MKRLTYYLCGILLLLVGIMPLSAQSQYKDTLVVAVMVRETIAR